MNSNQESEPQNNTVSDLKKLVHEVFDEYHNVQAKRTEPAYKAELEEERRKRESMEKRLNELFLLVVQVLAYALGHRHR